MKKRIVIAGATGLIGKQVVDELMALDGVELHTLQRSAANSVYGSVTQHVCATDQWPMTIKELKPAVAVNCLGTTIKIAGSQTAFRAVDYELVVAFAKAARESGAQHLISVSSVGASAKSSNFYLKTKGEAEDALRAMDFDRVDILRPGLLTGGTRPDSRPGEAIGIMLSPLTDLLMLGPLSRYRSTPSAKVAQAIVTLAIGGGHGKHIHENDSIRALAG
jgi:uncharacterized protein YbjT (DUF2867 family)